MRARTRRGFQVFVDVALLAWVAVWVLVGAFVAREVSELARFGDTLLVSADALEETASGLDTLSRLPLVGGGIGEVADRIDATADSVREQALAAQSNVRRLSYLLGAAIAGIPALAVLVRYLPGRVARFRERLEVRRALAGPHADHVRRHLAQRALMHVPYFTLLSFTEAPWRDFEEGRYDRLVRAELDRIGLPSSARNGET